MYQNHHRLELILSIYCMLGTHFGQLWRLNSLSVGLEEPYDVKIVYIFSYSVKYEIRITKYKAFFYINRDNVISG